MSRWALTLILATAPAWASPLPDSPAGRRAVRGAALTEARESDELRELRQFEKESFSPSVRDLDEAGDTAIAAPERHASLIGPDTLPPELRSPSHELGLRADKDSAIPWLSHLKLPDLPVRLEPRVLRYLEFYKNDKRGRAIMTSWLKKQGRWRGLFEQQLRKAQLPLALIYVSMIESGYDPHDRSRVGAGGLWQFMPDGGRVYGLRIDYWVDERSDPEKSTLAFVHYVEDLQHRFASWPLTLAAFNAGYGAVLRAMQKYNTNDYWELCQHEDGLPWETTLYVPKVMATAIVGTNRALFGYEDVIPDPPYTFDRVTVPTSMSLANIAKAAGVQTAAVAALNPELRRNRTPPEPWQVRLPKGSGQQFMTAYRQQKEALQQVVVRFGERLSDLAALHGITSRELRGLNGIDDSAEVTPGLTLLVPAGKKPLPPEPCETVIVAVPDKDAVEPGRKRVFYRTLPADTPTEIARFFKVKPADLARWNNIVVDAKLVNNMVLQLWVAPDFDTNRVALVDPARVRVVTCGSEEFFDLVEARRGRKRLVYRVRRGDDLKRIAHKFKLTVADLERINRFGAAHTPLTVGQKLTVYVPMTAAEKAKAACSITPSGEANLRGSPTSEPALPSLPRLPRDPIIDEQERAEEGVPQDAPLPRPPPSDGGP